MARLITLASTTQVQAAPAPADTAPIEAVSAGTAPIDTVPADTVPADTVPAKTVPAKTVAASAARTGAARGGSRNAARRTARRWVLLLAAGWLCQAGLRAWLSHAQVVPLANPDETAYLIAARVLAGGPDVDLSGSTLYQGGYPLLITPAYWFSSNPVTIYHIVLIINAAISALVMPLGFLACRRLGLDRRAAYGVAMIAALVPAGFFYSQYAMTDAIFPVITLAWLLTVHGWLTATSARARYAAAVGSALLAGYAYAVHSRGVVMLLGYAVRAAAMYPSGTRNLSAQMKTTLGSFYGMLHVVEMAAGQMWRLTLDSWGLAGIGLIAALAAIGRRGLRSDLRIMAALSVAVTILIAATAPAALPPDQSQTWASGRYLDGMIVTFFLVGAVVLLRASTSRILWYAACAAGLTVLAAVTVSVYAGTSLPTTWFGDAFNFAEPAVLTQNWTQASVPTATGVALGLLALWVAAAVIVRRRWRGVRRAGGLGVLGLGVAAVSLVALIQMTSQVSLASTPAQVADTTGLVTASGLRPGEQIAISSDLSWEISIPQAYEISWTEPESFNPASQPPPANATVVETAWATGQPAKASWPNAPAGWRIVASDQSGGWVAWRKG